MADRPDRTLALTTYVVDNAPAGSRGPSRRSKPLHDNTNIGSEGRLWQFVARLCPHGNNPRNREECGCPNNAFSGGPEHWRGEVRTIPSEMGDLYYRGYAVSPWPKESKRTGMRGVHCGHKHNDYDSALRCAWEVVRDLVDYHEDEPEVEPGT